MMATNAVHIKCQSVSRSTLSISHPSKFQSKSLFFSNRSTKLTEKTTLLGKHWLPGVSNDCLYCYGNVFHFDLRICFSSLA